MRLRLMLLIVALVLVSCSSSLGSTPTAVPSPVIVTLPTAPLPPLPTAVLGARATPQPAALTPLLAMYRARVAAALTKAIPILLLDAELTPAQWQAQDLAIHDARLQPYLRDQQTHQPYRVEVFGVYPLRDSDRTPALATCQPVSACYRVELYNFALNAAIRVVINSASQSVLSVAAQANTQPDIPQSLTDIASEIARNTPEVATATDSLPKDLQPLMTNTKTALNATRCERSEHLCVAPTFIYEEQALWAIVDLTDGVLVGLRWTKVGETGDAISEKSLQDAVITAGFCEKTTALRRNDWQLDYVLTSSDGLRISGVRYRGTPVFDSVKLVDWHVSYSRKEAFGYSDAVGCPVFSQAAVIATTPPVVEDLHEGGQVVGFTLTQSFWSELWPRPCSYNYKQTYFFYSDGRFRPAVASLGRGCGDDGTYRPVTRIALAGNLTAREWQSGNWRDWPTEGWRLDAGAAPAADGASYQFVNAAGAGLALTLGRGQFGDGGRGDNAYVYLTKQHPDRDEGDADMMTIGPCCNIDEHQGPEQFIDAPPEPISNAAMVLWYVPQLKNDDTPGKQYCWAESLLGDDGVYHAQTYPCWSGPLFTPLRGGL